MKDLKASIIKKSIWVAVCSLVIAGAITLFCFIINGIESQEAFTKQMASNACMTSFAAGCALSFAWIWFLFLVDDLSDVCNQYRMAREIEKIRQENEKLKQSVKRDVYVLEYYEKTPDDGELVTVNVYSKYEDALKALRKMAEVARMNFYKDFGHDFEEYRCGECEITYATVDDKTVARFKIRQTTMD